MASPYDSERYIAADLDHVIHSMTPLGQTANVVFARGSGCKLWDTDGKEYLDFTSGLVNVNIGHGRHEVAVAAFEQMKKLEFTHTMWGLSNTATIECAERLAELTPAGLKRFYFTCGGSEAVETALKVSRLFWRNQGLDKYKIISLEYSFHGMSYGALSATGLGGRALAARFAPLVPGFRHIPSYYCYRCRFGKEYPGCNVACARSLEQAIEEEGAGSVAAFMAEPVQGSAGMIPPPPEYWPIVKDICARHNVLLIADEVMTGFGRTGKMFATQHWNVVPDIMTMGKGITSGYLPFGAAALSDKVCDGLKASGAPFFHAFTYSGHPVCCAASVRNLQILVEEKLTERAAQAGRHLLQRVQEFMEFEHVGDVRGLGLMCSFELVEDRASRKAYSATSGVGEALVRRAREQGVLVRVWGSRVGMGPPLCISNEDIDKAVDVIKSIVARVPNV